jgi:hypothetical protein
VDGGGTGLSGGGRIGPGPPLDRQAQQQPGSQDILPGRAEPGSSVRK